MVISGIASKSIIWMAFIIAEVLPILVRPVIDFAVLISFLSLKYILYLSPSISRSVVPSMISSSSLISRTLILNIGCSLCQVVTCAVTGYGFARFKFKGRNLLFGIVILQILVPTQIISIPLYSTFRNFLFGTVNLIDNMLVMYLPALTANGIRAGLMIFIFRQFFRGLPKELEDAAYLDGCGPFKTFIQVMVPNAASSFLTVFLFSIVWYWNDYYVASSFFTNKETISTVLKNLDSTLNKTIFNNASAQISAREKIVWLEAACLISITPMLILYACLQKHFTEGIERSGLVG